MGEDEPSRLVDFEVGPTAAGPDEELPEPGRGRSHWSRRPLALGTAVLIAAALLVRALTQGGSSGRPTAAETVTAAPRPPAITQPAPLVLGGPGIPAGNLAPGAPSSRHRYCPEAGDGLPICSAVAQVPAQVLVALRERFPATQHVSVFEEQLRDVGFGPGGLWYRDVRARQGLRTIAVEVDRVSGSDHTRIVKHADARGSTLAVTRVIGGFAVHVRISGPAGRRASTVPPRALVVFASDARLRAPG